MVLSAVVLEGHGRVAEDVVCLWVALLKLLRDLEAVHKQRVPPFWVGMQAVEDLQAGRVFKVVAVCVCGECDSAVRAINVVRRTRRLHHCLPESTIKSFSNGPNALAQVSRGLLTERCLPDVGDAIHPHLVHQLEDSLLARHEILEGHTDARQDLLHLPPPCALLHAPGLDAPVPVCHEPCAIVDAAPHPLHLAVPLHAHGVAAGRDVDLFG
mmetsp:Transcript_49477/g.120778  ORF Transcript_49477/g.120778 Transcript_49477/m.120778 type:complete len:212 (+) Transcript_49477:475-1110(+)